MSDTKAERLADVLSGFIGASPDVEAAAVVSFDGLAMASALPADMDEDRLGAMSAALLSLGEQAAKGLGRGELRQVFVEGDDGYVFLMSAEDQAVLAAVTDSAAKIGLMLFEMRRAAHTVGAILDDRADAPVAYEALPAAPSRDHAAVGGAVHESPAPVAPSAWEAPPDGDEAHADNGSTPAGATLPPPWN